MNNRPVPVSVGRTSTTLSMEWDEPPLSDECTDVFSYPPLNYVIGVANELKPFLFAPMVSFFQPTVCSYKKYMYFHCLCSTIVLCVWCGVCVCVVCGVVWCVCVWCDVMWCVWCGVRMYGLLSVPSPHPHTHTGNDFWLTV